MSDIKKSSKFVYIHIGIPKTGTTAIQKFCFNNKNQLLKNKILYPDVSLRGYGHHDLAFLISNGYPDWAEENNIELDTLIDDLEIKTKNHTGSILLSSENFYLYPAPQKLYDILSQTKIIPDYKPRIIVYLRHQVHAHESWYNQIIKAQGSTYTIEESIKNFHSLFDYDENLKLWSDVFNKENICVQLYPDDNENKFNIINEFMTLLNISSLKEFTFEENKVNTKLNKDLLEYQKTINRLPVAIKEKRRFHKQLIELSRLSENKNLFNETPVISETLFGTIEKSYQQSNKKVAQQYLSQPKIFDTTLNKNYYKSSRPSELTIDKLAMINNWLLLNKQDG